MQLHIAFHFPHHLTGSRRRYEEMLVSGIYGHIKITKAAKLRCCQLKIENGLRTFALRRTLATCLPCALRCLEGESRKMAFDMVHEVYGITLGIYHVCLDTAKLEIEFYVLLPCINVLSHQVRGQFHKCLYLSNHFYIFRISILGL